MWFLFMLGVRFIESQVQGSTLASVTISHASEINNNFYRWDLDPRPTMIILSWNCKGFANLL